VRVGLAVRNDTAYANCHALADLRGLAKRICGGEGVAEDLEISVLLCDDATMQALNAQYAHKNEATDVLSFPQPDAHILDGPRALGDIAISLETVSRRCDAENAAMRAEVRLLFCHGLLHLLGFDHATACAKRAMAERQAVYLECSVDAAWFRGH